MILMYMQLSLSSYRDIFLLHLHHYNLSGIMLIDKSAEQLINIIFVFSKLVKHNYCIFRCQGIKQVLSMCKLAVARVITPSSS